MDYSALIFLIDINTLWLLVWNTRFFCVVWEYRSWKSSSFFRMNSIGETIKGEILKQLEFFGGILF